MLPSRFMGRDVGTSFWWETTQRDSYEWTSLPPSHSSPPHLPPLSKDIVHGNCCLLGLTKLLSDLHYDETPSKPCGEWWPIELRSQDKKKIPLDPTNFFYCLYGYKGTHESKLTPIIDGKKKPNNSLSHAFF